jgi:protein phosphatase
MKVGRTGFASHAGRRRRRNEDDYVVKPPLFAVADGMGGAQAGELASRVTTEALAEGSTGAGGEERVVALIQEANRRVFTRAAEDAAASGMGTTVTAALVENDGVWIGHVGDSRAYLLRNGTLEQLTEDHSLVAELQRSGKLSAEEAEMHPQRSVITRALGTDPDVDVDRLRIPARPGDIFLICSDGLSSMVDDETIRKLVEQNRNDLEAAATALENAANKAGGEDNITVVAFEIVGDDDPFELEQTAQYPAPGMEQEPEPDEEDTLSGIERVPAVDTMVVPPGEAAKLAEGAEPKRRKRARLIPALLLILVALAIVAIVLWTLHTR